MHKQLYTDQVSLKASQNTVKKKKRHQMQNLSFFFFFLRETNMSYAKILKL